MALSFTAHGKTQDGQLITGNVVFSNATDMRIIAYQFFCNGLMHCGSGANAGSISFIAGPTPDQICTTNGFWRIGSWSNDGTGVWFKHVDGTIYPSSSDPSGIMFGNRDDYRYLAPRIDLCADLVTGGPFCPFGHMELVWNPQFYCSKSYVPQWPLRTPARKKGALSAKTKRKPAK